MTEKRFEFREVNNCGITPKVWDNEKQEYLNLLESCKVLNELHEENQSYKQNVSKTLQKHYNRLVELSNNKGEDECGFMAFIKFLSQELDVELEDLE